MRILSLNNNAVVQRRALVAAAVTGTAALGTGIYLRRRELAKASNESLQRLKLSRPLAAAISGSLGEVIGLVLLYPLDTIKVRCQVRSTDVQTVVRDLLKDGWRPRVISSLYAGVWGAVLCSVIVGGMHLASYEVAKTAVINGLTGASAAAAARSGQPVASSSAAGGDAKRPQRSKTQPSAAGPASATAPAGGDDAAGAALPPSFKFAANMAAAVAAAMLTATVESPVELFRHNAQAGLLQGNILKRMFETTRSQGLGGLYWGFWPYCFESWPYDVSELVVYGHLKDLRQEACTASTSAAAAEVSATGAAARGGRWGRKGGNGGSSSGRTGDKGGAACEATASSPEQQQKHRWVSRLPDDVWDLATGAAAGATAVVLSMPLDCIKTAVQTSGTDVAGRGLAGSARVFVATGKALVERRGLGALYVGLTPRLLQQVPSAMACWWTVEACKRALAPYTVSSPGQA